MAPLMLLSVHIGFVGVAPGVQQHDCWMVVILEMEANNVNTIFCVKYIIKNIGV